MYEALIMIAEANKSEFWQAYVEKLRAEVETGQAFGKGATLSISDERLELTSFSVIFTVDYNDDDHVVEESKEIAEEFAAGLADHADLARASSRLEINSTPDTNMDAFNSFVFLAEIAERVGKTWAFDPRDGELM